MNSNKTNLNTKWILKLLGVNFAIFGILLFGIETISLMGRYLIKKPFAGYLLNIGYQKYLASLKNPCNRFVSHPILGHTHEINDKCKVKDGEIIGPYILYNYGRDNKDTIITLGGSTTDGFFNDINNGITWSTELSKLLYKNSSKYSVLNGGVGSYGSSEELFKLLIDIPRIKREKNIKYVISLNGINELPGDYYYFSFKLPLWNYLHIKLADSKKYLDQSPPVTFQFLPSTNTLIQYISRNKINDNLIKKSGEKWLHNFDLPFGNLIDTNPFEEVANQWEYNVKNMNAITTSNGAKYFVFLQPTMGLLPNQIPKDINSNDFKIYGNRSELYYKNINNLYKELRLKCSKLDFCIDISSKVTPKGDLYNDPRHHNEKGNKKIAKIIYMKIKNDIQSSTKKNH